MRRLLAALVLISAAASAQTTLQSPGVPGCNQWGFCPSFSTPFVDAGTQTAGLVAADHLGGHGNTPSCYLDGGGFTSCAVHGNDVAGVVVLNAGSPSTNANTLLFSLFPDAGFDSGYTCIITPANPDAGQVFGWLMVNVTQNGGCNVGLANQISIGWPSATGAAFNYFFGGH